MRPSSTEPEFAPRRDDFAEMLGRAARRRRTRRTALLGTAPVAVAGLALAFAGMPDGTARLTTLKQHSPAASASVTPAPVRHEFVTGGECASGTWCFQYLGPDPVASGVPVDLTFRLCRAADAGAGTLTRKAGGVHWLRLAISDGPAAWSWYAPSPPQEQSVEVGAGNCLQWIVGWPGTDDAGDPMPPGSYTLSVAFLARGEFPDLVNQVSFTVTG